MTLSIVGWLALGEKNEANGDNRVAMICVSVGVRLDGADVGTGADPVG